MYTESNLAVKSEGKMPVFETIKERFEKENAHQSELLNQLQSKLHNLLNRRGPEIETMKEVPPLQSDFSSAMQNEIDRMRNNTTKLQNILSHLNDIL